MAYCVHCGKELAEGVRFCPECGGEQLTAAPDPEKEALQKKTNADVENEFGRALAATICSAFPVASIVAIVLGVRALEAWKKATAAAAEHGFKLTGKNIAVRVLALVGKIAGIVMTAFWGIYFLILLAVVIAGIAYGF